MRPSNYLKAGWCQGTYFRDKYDLQPIKTKQIIYNKIETEFLQCCLGGSLILYEILNNNNNLIQDNPWQFRLALASPDIESISSYLNARVKENGYTSYVIWQDMEIINQEEVVSLMMEAESLILDGVPQ